MHLRICATFLHVHATYKYGRKNKKPFSASGENLGLTKELRHNASAGIVLSDQSLVLQGITRDSSGNYSCVAANSEGRNRSNIIHLHVMFAPICKSLVPSTTTKSDISSEELATFELIDDNELESFNATSHKTLDLICEVEATPNDVTFHWTFNNSRGLVEVSDRKFSSEETVSRLRHLLRTDSDYGTFGCWASNIVGHSKQPCMYHVPTPVSPLPLQNCTAHNQSGSVIRISCVEGFDGGLPQKFVAVLDEQRHESHTPNWEIQIHKPSTVTLYAVNAKGSSDPVVIEGIAFKDVAKFTGETGIPLELSPILIGLGGTATGLGLIPSIATFTVKGEEEDGNPDLIPTTALTNNYTDRKLSVYGSLPRGSNFSEDQMMPRSLLQEMHYPRAAPNTYYSLQRPTRYTESIVRHTTVQESCI
ncbi:hypothetical protein QAD02_005772 [Eretmocerus hayati]|uniref:Uncharacterized protein n=1 Tax=Eretmocerus hayati TaxID=131215 RepID=A0ACC2NTG4_9HYME|nr:hypothetical protein QAD02_005772 [Eretmocerus hayati]